MAFSFGAAASAPAFGASSAPAFGFALAPAFGAAAAAPSNPGFSFGSTPAFGAAASTPAFGAAASAPAFGAASGGSLFGGASTPSLFSAPASASAFGAPASTPSLFGAASTPSLFGGATAPASTSAFSFGTAAAQTGGALGLPSAQPAGTSNALALQGQQQPSTTVTSKSKFDDLHPSIQKELADIDQEISRNRDDCDRLDRDQRLNDSTALKQSMEEDTHALKRALLGLANAIKTDDEALADFREKVMRLLRCTESAMRTYQRAKLWRESPKQYTGQLVPPQVQELLSMPVVLPNPYLELAVQGFTDALDSYRQVVCELEAALPPGAQGYAPDGSGALPMATALPAIVSHMHDYFVHVAAQLEQLHNQVERSKAAFLSQRQAAGDHTNPFEDSRRLQHLAAATSRPMLLPADAHITHHHHHHHGMAYGHGAGHQLHAGTPHGPGGAPMPGAFGTPLSPLPVPGAAPQAATGGGDSSRKQKKK